MRICILEHQPDAPAGYFGEWAASRGHTHAVLQVPALHSWPGPTDYDVVVSLGSDRSVHASSDVWIEPEINFIRERHQHSAPVFGICFGAQILAAALGGAVTRAVRPRAEWRTISTKDPDLISTGPWLRWHEDVFELPPHARLLAGRPEEPLAFVVGNSVGVQFHPEATASIVEGWIESERERLVEQGIEERQLRDEIRQAETDAQARAFGLFDVLSANWPTRG